VPLIAAHELNIDSGSTQVYNGMDCAMTFEINAALHKLGHNDNTIYDFERALQAPALEMMQRGFRVDINSQQIAVGNTRRKIEATKQVLEKLAQAVWDKGVNPNSGDQLKDLFYQHMGIPPLTAWVRGEQKTPMDRKILERLEIHFYARPIRER
jgi:DNA polymerase I-like protein with 3'-5' exonuclease and polymerase domains